MKTPILTLVVVLAPMGVMAQEMPLWRLESHTTPQGVPAYGGGLSPFALSAPAPLMTANPNNASEDESTRAMQRESLLAQARQLSQPKRAFQPKMYAPAKALTNGGKGLRVLVGGDWIGIGEPLPLSYEIQPETRRALLELQRVDEAAARELANALEQSARDFEGKPGILKAIDPIKRQVVLSGALGEVVLPLNVAE
jgi:hypothetical protein